MKSDERPSFHYSESSTDVKHYLCGVGSFRPQWLQYFATPRYMFVFYNLLGIIQGAFKTYTVGTLTTLEKRFALSTTYMGLILISDNLSPILINLLIGHYANRFSRPKLLSAGMFIVAISSMLVALPYGIYGPATHLLQNAVGDKFELCRASVNDEKCQEGSRQGTTGALPFAILFFAGFMNGIGQSVFFVAGSTYMDDNLKKKNTPLYFGSTMAIRMIGPVIGFIVSALCLQLYENPYLDPGILPTDPRWVGAWWLGYLIFGSCLAVASLPMLLFPRIMPNKMASSPLPKSTANSQFREFSASLRRLLKNRVYLLQTFACIFFIIGVAGFGTFQPKYVQSQFRVTASQASGVTGFILIVAVASGFFLSGYVIHRFQFGARIIASYNAFVHAVMVCCFFGAMFIKCDSVAMPGVHISQNSMDLVNNCNQDCHCTTNVYQPVCGPEGTGLFFSPCFAGCSSFNYTGRRSPEFKDCRCLLEQGGLKRFFQGVVTQGIVTNGTTQCGSQCNMLYSFIAVISVAQVVGITSIIGFILIALRCIEERDKNMSLAFSSTIMNLVAFIPYPMIYSRISDNACLVWQSSCGRQGNCWIYDLDKFRYSYFLTTIAFMSFAVVLLIFVAIYSGDIKNFFDDSPAEIPEEETYKMMLDPASYSPEVSFKSDETEKVNFSPTGRFR